MYKNKIKRKISNYLIEENLQLSLIFRFLIIMILLTIFFVFIIYIVCWPVILEYVPKSMIYLLKEQIFLKLYSVSFILLFIIAVICIIFTHKIAGPVYHLEKVIDKVIKGEDFELVHLRNNDELKSLASKINHLILSIKQSQTAKIT